MRDSVESRHTSKHGATGRFEVRGYQSFYSFDVVDTAENVVLRQFYSRAEAEAFAEGWAQEEDK